MELELFEEKLREWLKEEFKTTDYELVWPFDIPHLGWESDNIGYIIKVKSEMKFITTTHGNFYIGSIESLNVEYEKVKHYTRDIQEAINWLKK